MHALHSEYVYMTLVPLAILPNLIQINLTFRSFVEKNEGVDTSCVDPQEGGHDDRNQGVAIKGVCMVVVQTRLRCEVLEREVESQGQTEGNHPRYCHFDVHNSEEEDTIFPPNHLKKTAENVAKTRYR